MFPHQRTLCKARGHMTSSLQVKTACWTEWETECIVITIKQRGKNNNPSWQQTNIEINLIPVKSCRTRLWENYDSCASHHSVLWLLFCLFAVSQRHTGPLISHLGRETDQRIKPQSSALEKNTNLSSINCLPLPDRNKPQGSQDVQPTEVRLAPISSDYN